jgi:predicted nucleic acid-binding protein
MIRAVVDSDVYISALLFGGVPLAVLRLAEEGEFTLCVSEPIRVEVEGSNPASP